MRTTRAAVLGTALILVPLSAFAKTIAITQPHGGTFRKGQSMTITWTKDFTAPAAPANRMLIKLYVREGDIILEHDLIEEVNVNAGQFVWPDVGHTKNKGVPADSDYMLLLIMKTDAATFAYSSPFTVKDRFPMKQEIHALNTIDIYMPWQNAVFKFGEACPVVWSRVRIESYGSVFFYVRRPDGSNAAVNQMFATASNAASAQASGDPVCGSGNCGIYYITISKDALLPSPDDQYYIDMFTSNRKYVGKSKLFYWK